MKSRLYAFLAAIFAACAFNVSAADANSADKTGVVKSFDPAKGYGFITPDDKSADVFFARTGMQAPGPDPRAGQKVVYQVQSGPKGAIAVGVRAPGTAASTGGGSPPPPPPPVKPAAANQTGIVKTFDDTKGYGFITPDDRSADVFFHFSALSMPGFKSVKAGQKVIYDFVATPKGEHANNVRLADAKSNPPAGGGVGAGGSGPPPVKPAGGTSDRTGVVKSFDDAKGYGFITPDDKSADVFVHFSAVHVSGFKTLKRGQKVVYDVVSGPKGTQASNVRMK